MEEIVSMIVANGLWAALFCVLLGYELRDSRKREARYTLTITSLSERLSEVGDVKSDTEIIKSDTSVIRADVEEIKADVKAKPARRGAKTGGGRVCAAEA